MSNEQKKLLFFLLLFYLYQTLKETVLSEILDKDFSSKAFVERKKIKIRTFPKTSTKTFSKYLRDGLEEMETSWPTLTSHSPKL